MITVSSDANCRGRGVPRLERLRGALLALLGGILMFGAGSRPATAQVPSLQVLESSVSNTGESQGSDSVEARGFEHVSHEVGGPSDLELVDPERVWKGGQWVWRTDWGPWWVGFGMGALVALALLIGAARTMKRPVLSGPYSERGPFARLVLGPDGRRWLIGLLKDRLAWTYVLVAAFFGGAIYVGAFKSLTGWMTELSPVARYAPALLGSLAAVVGGRFPYWIPGNELKQGDSKAIAKAVQKNSSWLVELVRVRLDDRLTKGIWEVAERQEIGLIQRATWETASEAVDKGTLLPSEREALLAELLEIRPAPEGRAGFLSRTAAVRQATKLVCLDDLEHLLGKYERRGASPDRRKASSSQGAQERRRGVERRVGSPWRPALQLESQVAS